jgi:hypothetical protein
MVGRPFGAPRIAADDQNSCVLNGFWLDVNHRKKQDANQIALQKRGAQWLEEG